MYAEIIIPLALPKNYTWSVPDHFLQEIKPGCRVEVNLGRNKKYAGIVKRIHDEKPIGFEAKEIMNVLDAEPIIQPFQLLLWKWMAEYYMCTEGEVMAAALPAHFKLSSETVIIYNEEFGDDFSGLDNDEYRFAELLLSTVTITLRYINPNTGTFDISTFPNGRIFRRNVFTIIGVSK